MVLAFAADRTNKRPGTGPLTTLTLQTKGTKPPRPPAGLAAVLLDESDVCSELVVAVDTDDTLTVQLHAPGLEASGAVPAAVRRFRDRSAFALADVPVVGYDHRAERCVTGKVHVGLMWTDDAGPDGPEVSATALADGTWLGGLFRFGTVAHHSFSLKVVRMVSTGPAPRHSRMTDRR